MRRKRVSLTVFCKNDDEEEPSRDGGHTLKKKAGERIARQKQRDETVSFFYLIVRMKLERERERDDKKERASEREVEERKKQEKRKTFF